MQKFAYPGVCALAGLMVAAGLARVSPAQIAHHHAIHGHHDHDGLAPLDARTTPDGALTEKTAASVRAWQSSASYASRAEAIRALALRVPGLVCDEHPMLGGAHFLRSPAALLSAPDQPRAAKGAYAEILADFVDAHRDAVGIDRAELAGARIVRDFDTHGIMHHLTHQQVVDGLDVYGAILRSSFTTRGEIINLSSAMATRPATGWTIPRPVLTEEAALRAAASSVGCPIVNPVAAAARRGAGPTQKTVWTTGAELDHWTDVTTQPVLFPLTREELRPAYVVVVPTKGIGHTYEVVIDAVSGAVLWRQNWLKNLTTEPVSYRFYASDSPAPWSPGPATNNGAQAPFVPRAFRTVLPAEISTFSPDGWIPDGGTTTTGNNVDAYLDADATLNSPDPGGRPVSATRVFDLAVAVDGADMPTGAPSTYGHASVAHGFYHANLYHDRLYAMGFNEGAGNFQLNNFGQGGVQGDYVRMEMQDGAGTNNANFAVNADGGVGRCQMFIFTGPTPDRDGGLDQDILYHELTHGTSTRCHENTLSGEQAGGMGEGWGDFFGICLNAQPGDDFNGVYATGGHTTYLITTTYTTNYYFGIRRFPYSTDMTKSPLTYGDIVTLAYDAAVPRNPAVATSNTADLVHGMGEIWCQTLLEARAFIGLDEGFAANETIMQLVLDAMKLAPSNPSFLQERDALLQADQVRYGGQHQFRLWQAFAKRGMGYTAVSPTGNAGTGSGVVENFDPAPAQANMALPDGAPARLVPGASTNLRVTVAPYLLTITPNTAEVFYSVNDGPYASAPMPLTGTNEYTATLPAFGCNDLVRYYFSLGTSVGVQKLPASAPAATFSAHSFTPTQEWTMEADEGWTAGPSTATSGIWNRMAPQATFAQPGADTTPGSAVACWITNGNAGTAVGTNDIDAGYTYLNSPTFDASGLGDVVIEYNRWVSNASTATPPATYGDPWLVEISNNNGATWTPFESIAVGAPHQQAWVPVSRSLSSAGVAPTSQMRLRFRAEDSGTASISEAAVDDVLFYPVVCTTTPTCDSIDFNGDGLFPDTQDIDDFLVVFSGGTCPNAPNCGDLDFNNDGLFPDTADIDSLLSEFSGGPCP
jgi:hypothetical protein